MTDQAPELLPDIVADRIEQIRAYTVDELGYFILRGTDGEIAAHGVKVFLVNENNRKVIVQALRALTRPPSERPVAQMREAVKNALRTFCESLGARVVTASSDGVERIYYSGLSLDALSVAAAMAALTAERPEAAVAMIERSEFEIVRKASRLFEDAANAWMERALKAEAALAIQHEEPGRETMTSVPEGAKRDDVG